MCVPVGVVQSHLFSVVYVVGLDCLLHEVVDFLRVEGFHEFQGRADCHVAYGAFARHVFGYGLLRYARFSGQLGLCGVSFFDHAFQAHRFSLIVVGFLILPYYSDNACVAEW